MSFHGKDPTVTDRIQCASVRLWRGVLPAMAIASFYAVALGIRSTLSFPYLQTLVDCDAPTEVPRSSPDWPGSANCNDTDTVVGQAQVLRGFCSASDLTI